MSIVVVALAAQAAAVAPSPVQIAPVAPPPPIMTMPARANPHEPIPQAYPGTWVTSSDYPVEALRNQVEGTSRFTATVSPSGQVTACKITDSSGSAALDAATCALVTRRARFTPATDKGGNPIAGSYSSQIRWAIPGTPPPVPGTVAITFIVDELGRVHNCKMAVEGQAADMAAALGRACSSPSSNFGTRDGFKAYTDSNGKPIPKLVTIRYSVETVPLKQ